MENTLASNVKGLAGEPKTVLLKFIGYQENGDGTFYKLWNIESHLVVDGADYYRSTRSLDGLKQLKILKGAN